MARVNAAHFSILNSYMITLLIICARFSVRSSFWSNIIMTKIVSYFFQINNDLKHYSQTLANIAHVTEPKCVFTQFRLTRNHQSQGSTKPSTLNKSSNLWLFFSTISLHLRLQVTVGSLGK